MCTLIILARILPRTPLLIGFNRDEYYKKQEAAPRLWEGKNYFLAPVDLASKGTWAGTNTAGLSVGVLNYLPLKRVPQKSRGQLIVDILSNCTHINEASSFLQHKNILDYSPSTFFLADSSGTVKLIKFHREYAAIGLVPGIYVFSDTDVFENHAIHQKWLTKILKENIHTLGKAPDPAWAITKLLSEHKSHYSREMTTCCHAELSGTLSSLVIASDAHHQYKSFLYSSDPPCVGKYKNYAQILQNHLTELTFDYS